MLIIGNIDNIKVKVYLERIVLYFYIEAFFSKKDKVSIKNYLNIGDLVVKSNRAI